MNEPLSREYWLVKFDDTDMDDLIYPTEDSAVRSYTSHSEAWNCHLFYPASTIEGLRTQLAAQQQRIAELEQQVQQWAVYHEDDEPSWRHRAEKLAQQLAEAQKGGRG
jgi:hypothetical protein